MVLKELIVCKAGATACAHKRNFMGMIRVCGIDNPKDSYGNECPFAKKIKIEVE